jgi:hypothetical protein
MTFQAESVTKEEGRAGSQLLSSALYLKVDTILAYFFIVKFLQRWPRKP